MLLPVGAQEAIPMTCDLSSLRGAADAVASFQVWVAKMLGRWQCLWHVSVSVSVYGFLTASPNFAETHTLLKPTLC